MKKSALEAFFSSIGINPEYISPMSKLTSGSESTLYSASCEYAKEMVNRKGLTGCSASEELRSSTRGTVCLTCVQSLICSLMYCLIGLVLASARNIAKTRVLHSCSDVKDESACYESGA